MSRNENQKRWNLWLIAAMIAPLAHWSGAGYGAVLLATLAAVPLTLLPRCGKQRGRKTVLLLQWIWALLVLAHLLPASAGYWEGGGRTIPLTLVTLAALSGSREKADRAGNTLFWLIAPVLGLIILLASRKVEPEWLVMNRGKWTAELLITLLLPAAGVQLTAGEGRSRMALSTAMAALLFAVLLQGTLSGDTARTVSAPMYEVGRTIGRGTEILVSVVMTLSWYALSSMLFETASGSAKGAGIPAPWDRGISWGLVSAMIFVRLQIHGIVLLTGCILLWILLPILHLKK